jgi:mono/diheme cytochrome c family protein
MQPDYRVSSMLGGRRVRLWTALCAALAAVGCGKGEPQFVSRAEVQTLMPEAEAYVHELLDQNFGTPTHSIAWERLPIRYHAATGTVATVTEGNTAEMTLAPAAVAGSEEEPAPGTFEQWLPIVVADPQTHAAGMEVLFVSGDVLQAMKEQEQAQQPVSPVHVKSYDAATRKLVLSAPPAVAPQPGDRLIIGPGEVLKHGRMLYAEHCQHCHGVSGDGNGPTARYLNPLPRDYRSAIFKFTSTQTPRRAQRGDLAHIIEEGIPGTYMPSFKLLLPEESTALVEYVLWLSWCKPGCRYKALSGFRTKLVRSAVGERVCRSVHEQFATDFDDDRDIAANGRPTHRRRE